MNDIMNDNAKKRRKRVKNRSNIGNLYARNPDGTFVKYALETPLHII